MHKMVEQLALFIKRHEIAFGDRKKPMLKSREVAYKESGQ
jgi:hypothetical protein